MPSRMESQNRKPQNGGINSPRKIIVAEDLTKVYSDHGIPVKALDRVNLTVRSGEFTALVGPSGSGKTTLLNVISGLDKPTGGNVLLNGMALKNMSGAELAEFRRDHIGFIFQAYNLIPVLTVEENAEYVLLLQGVEHEKRREMVRTVLSELGLKGLEKRLPAELSGGQQQRVAIARAIASGPSIVLADEPTANLDSHTGAELLDMMYALNQEKSITFLFSTHDEMVIKRASRYITLRDGRVVEDITKEEKNRSED